jgi:Protein of unknown function (DUF3237)
MAETIAVQEHIYDMAVQLTQIIDFGIDAQSLASGRTPMPPQGVRFDASFNGEMKGPKLRGKVAGTNYLQLRADGVGVINGHAVLTTEDGDRIAIHADGVQTREQGSPVYQYRENLTFYTASPKYSWVNRIQGWATGTGDLSSGKITMKGYTA